MAPISFKEAFRFWLKLGLISFGGPAGQIAIMHQELVDKKRWISEGRFLHALNYCMLLPGPEAQQLATYIGWLMHRSWGGIVAGALFVLPSLFILILLSWLYIAFGHHSVIAGLFYGIKPAVVAIVVHALHRIGSRALKNSVMWGIAAAAFVAIFAFKLPFPLIVAMAALIGYLGGRYQPSYFQGGSGHKASQNTPSTPAWIDDDTPAPAHAQFSPRKFGLVLASGALLWCLPMALLYQCLGWEHALTQMAWFFTKAALLTFGGAYAVLPYVYQGAVDHYRWLSGTQMIDGLALGETTPGPLIMVVAFVGFVAAYQGAWAVNSPFLAGVAAASLVTWFTFLPSFIFILAGAPFIESTHRKLQFTAPLTAITAAVVGVILNLALFFAWHVLWPQGSSGHFAWPAALLTLGAAVALFYFKRSVMQVIGASAVIGYLMYTLIGMV